MAKVGEKSSNETLAQLKDTYQQRETDLETRHKDQLRDVNDSHHVEITRLRKEGQDRLKASQESASAKLNQKDLAYQKEIESLRSMYSKKVIADTKSKKTSEEES